jgi:PAS domain S-box-containing protein
MGISPQHQGERSEWADANCRAVLEAAPDAMLVVNRAGEIVAANLQSQKLYGYSREHLIGRVVESLIPARLRDRHRQNRENFFANPKKQAMQVIEIFAVRSDASEIPVDVSLSLLTIGTETFVISAVRDATERRHLEELKRGEAVLREKQESEERFRLAAQAGKMYAYEWDIATDLVVRSEEQMNVLGFSQPRQLTRQELLARVHPEDRALFVASVDQLTPQYPTTQISYRVLRPDGSVVWLEKNARGFFDHQGKLLRVIGMVANITERKRAEEALSDVNRKLIEAQEQERTRIGRELHDDIGQRLAMVAVQLQQVHEDSLVLPEVRTRMGELKREISEIANDIQSLSHELHSSKLEYLGIAAAMRSFCKEFGEHHRVEIDFQTHDLPSPLSPDSSLCLFRVLQEALLNSAKHSGVRHVEVQLWGTSDAIHLTVNDSGVGFDSEAVKQSGGLGLISMEERLKHVKGTFSIESEPKGGTTIHARVPLDSSSDSARAAG